MPIDIEKTLQNALALTNFGNMKTFDWMLLAINFTVLIGSCRREMVKCLTHGQEQQYGFGFGFDYHLSLRSRLKYSMTMIYSFHFHSWWLRLKKCSTENILKTIFSDCNTFQHPSSKFTIQISFSNSIVYEND